MPQIGFSYIPRLVQDSNSNATIEVFNPLVPVRLSVHHSNPTRLIDALVDSGADRNLFPMKLGDILGINFRKVTPKVIYGIGNAQIEAYTAKVNVWLEGTKYLTEADFSPQQDTLLLGRQGFFNLFKKLIFDERGKFLYIELF